MWGLVGISGLVFRGLRECKMILIFLGICSIRLSSTSLLSVLNITADSTSQ